MGNMIDRYIDRPSSSFNGGRYSVLDNFCYAEFLRYYYIVSNLSTENDYQPEEVNDHIIEENHSIVNDYPKVIPLMS